MEYSELTRRVWCPPCLVRPQPVALQPPVLTSGGLRRQVQVWNFLPVEASPVVEGPLD